MSSIETPQSTIDMYYVNVIGSSERRCYHTTTTGLVTEYYTDDFSREVLLLDLQRDSDLAKRYSKSSHVIYAPCASTHFCDLLLDICHNHHSFSDDEDVIAVVHLPILFWEEMYRYLESIEFNEQDYAEWRLDFWMVGFGNTDRFNPGRLEIPNLFLPVEGGDRTWQEMSYHQAAQDIGSPLSRYNAVRLRQWLNLTYSYFSRTLNDL